MKTQIEKLPKYVVKLTVTVEKDKVKEAYDRALSKASENVEIEGFRKGAAPKEMVRDRIGISNLYGEAINDVLQTYYPQALKENKIMPVSNPKVDIKEFDMEKDLVFTAEVATRPEVKMGEYKKALKEYFEDKKKKLEKEKEEKLKKDDLKPEEKEAIEKSHFHMSANEVIDVLVKESNVDIADILIEEETDRMMQRLVDQLETIKLPLEKYLKAQEKTPDSIKKEYNSISEKNIKAEFVLSYLITSENIQVEDKEIDDMIGAVGDKSMGEKLNDPMQRLYIKTILQKNKLLTKLIEETEGEKHEHK